MGDSPLDPCSYLRRKLRMGSIADAQHDFFGKSLAELGFSGMVGSWKFDVNLYVGLDAPCPDDPKSKNPKKEPVKEEDPLLYDLFEDAGSPYGIRDDKSNFTEKLIGILKRESFKLTIPELNKHDDYTIKLLNKDGETDLKTIFTDNLLTSADLIAFFGSTHIDVLIDTDNIHFMKMLYDVIKKDKSFSVNKIINREHINDSAPKSYDDINGIKNIIDITDNGGVVYWDNKPSTPPKSFEIFYSKYSLSLNKINNINTSKHLNVQFTIERKSDDTTLYRTSDSKNNSIQALCKSMWNPETNEFLLSPDQISARYQVKRAGDWLQALSCLDMNRLYASKDIHNKYVNHYKLNDHAILVTIDRILVWYCLLVGVDVVYLNADNSSMIYFKKGIAVKEAEKRPLNNNNNSSQPPAKKRRQIGGTNKPSQELFISYIKQLISDIELFETDEDSDFTYYKYLAIIVLSCIKNTSRKVPDYYESLKGLFYNSLPCDEGTMETDNKDIKTFFNNDFTSDCVAFAARQVALHSLGQRTGTIHVTNTYDISTLVYITYKQLLDTLNDKSFDDTKTFLTDRLNDLIKHAPKIHNTSGIKEMPQSMKTGNKLASPPKYTFSKTARVGGKRNLTRRLK